MSLLSNTSVLFFAIDAGLAPQLSRIAIRHAWPVRQTTSAAVALREAVLCRPTITVVQVLLATGEAVELIRLVRAGSLPVLQLAVALMHDDEIERAVRIAGVDCYLGGVADEALIEQTVAELLKQRSLAAARSHGQRTAPRRQDQRFSSSSFPLPTNASGGLEWPAAHSGRPRDRACLRAPEAGSFTRPAIRLVGRSRERTGNTEMIAPAASMLSDANWSHKSHRKRITDPQEYRKNNGNTF